MDSLPLNPNPPPLSRLAFFLLEELDAAFFEFGEMDETDGLGFENILKGFSGLCEAGGGGGGARGGGGRWI